VLRIQQLEQRTAVWASQRIPKTLQQFCDIAWSLSSESQQGKEVGEIHESLGFMPLGVSQELSTILLIQQHMQALLHAVRQPKPRQVIGDLNFDLN
jgi:hypothetical protein